MVCGVVGSGPGIVVSGWRVTTFVGHAVGLILAHFRYAPNSLRRNAAALPKIRMPSTTMMAVDNCVPTPN